MPQPKLSLFRRAILRATGCTALMRQYHAENTAQVSRIANLYGKVTQRDAQIRQLESLISSLETDLNTERQGARLFTIELGEMTDQFREKCDELATLQAEFDEHKTSSDQLSDQLRAIISEARAEIPSCDSVTMQCSVPREIKDELHTYNDSLQDFVKLIGGLDLTDEDARGTIEDALSNFETDIDSIHTEAFSKAEDMRQACEDLRDIGYRRGLVLKELRNILGE